jgi:sulfate transport system ATP-binding protein
MHQGGVEQIGSPAEIYNQPASPFVAGFIGSANVIRGRVEQGHLRFGEHVLPSAATHLPDGAAAHAYVRPADVRIADESTNGSAYRAIVQRIHDLGASSKIRFTLSDGQVLLAELANETLPLLAAGQDVLLDLRNVKVFEPDDDGAAERVPAAVA